MSHSLGQALVPAPAQGGPQFLAEQERRHRLLVEQRHRLLLDKIEFLAQFDKYDAKAGIAYRDKLLKRPKIPKAEFNERLKAVQQEIQGMEPVKLFMFSQYATRTYDVKKLNQFTNNLKRVRQAILTASGEEEAMHVPHVLRREFHLMEVSLSGLQLRGWQQILGMQTSTGGTALVPGIAIQEDGPRHVEGVAMGTRPPQTRSRSESPPPRPAPPPPPPDDADDDDEEPDEMADPFVTYDEDPEPAPASPAPHAESHSPALQFRAATEYFPATEFIPPGVQDVPSPQRPPAEDDALEETEEAAEGEAEVELEAEGEGEAARLALEAGGGEWGEAGELPESPPLLPRSRPSDEANELCPTIEAEATARLVDLMDDFGELDCPTEWVTKQTYDWAKKEWSFEEVQVQIDWAEPIAEGTNRCALRLCDLSLPVGEQSCVVKFQKPHCFAGDEQVYIDVEMQMACRAIAEAYNAHNPPKPVQFLDAWVIVRDKPNLPPYMAVLAVEPYLNPKNYIKHNNNCGFVSPLNRNTPQAFSHFSWEYTKHMLMVVDIQGVGDIYTDPQIHAAKGQCFGIGNIGLQGIRAFLSTHKCNPICQALGLSPVDETAADPSGTSCTFGMMRLSNVDFRLSHFLGALQPIRNGALPEELAVLGMEAAEFNGFVDLWQSYTSDDVLFSREAKALLRDLHFCYEDLEAPAWATDPAKMVSFKELLCYYCGID